MVHLIYAAYAPSAIEFPDNISRRAGLPVACAPFRPGSRRSRPRGRHPPGPLLGRARRSDGLVPGKEPLARSQDYGGPCRATRAVHDRAAAAAAGRRRDSRAAQAASDDRDLWQRRLLKLRQDQAAALFELAVRSARCHMGTLAYRLAQEAIQADPDHEGARRVFGYAKYQKQWRTSFELMMLRNGMTWSDKFGWIERVNLPRYAAGERLFGDTWIEAASDAALHAEITAGWDILTEHYRIRTNRGIEAAVTLGAKLENLQRVWRQVFLRYYASEAEIESLFNQQPPRVEFSPRLDVVYFRNKEQYHKALKPMIPDVGISMGVYVPENRTAYFYAGSEDSERSMYHEATHQLFQQSRPNSDNAGRRANCWLIEGIAMYMESLRRQGDSFVLGGLNDVRLQACAATSGRG